MTSEQRILMLEQKLKTLQMLYASALADATVRYGDAGILDEITEQKRAEQMKTGASMAERLGVRAPSQAFQKTQDICGCANWACEETQGGFTATCTQCMLCSISKKMGAYSPCRVFCLSPIEAMIQGLAPNAGFTVTETLWESGQCRVSVTL